MKNIKKHDSTELCETVERFYKERNPDSKFSEPPSFVYMSYEAPYIKYRESDSELSFYDWYKEYATSLVEVIKPYSDHINKQVYNVKQENTMSDFKTRLKDEYDELATKKDSLWIFLKGDVYKELSLEAQGLLTIQFTTMQSYLHILGLRLDLLNK